MSAQTVDYSETKLRLGDSLSVESAEADSLVVFHADHGHRVRLSRALYDFICRFSKSSRIADVLRPEQLDQFRPILHRLMGAEILVLDHPIQPAVDSGRVFAISEDTLFRAPRRIRQGEAADVAVIGVPYDLGNVIMAGARRGPSAIRAASRQHQYLLQFRSTRPIGWLDAALQERILEGRIIADWGDVEVHYGEAPAQLFARVETACTEAIESHSLPLFLGGDHSIAFPIVKALQTRGPIGLIWLDAHLDNGEIRPNLCNNNKNVLTAVLDLPNVVQVTNLGFRGYLTSNDIAVKSPKLRIISIEEIQRRGPESLGEALSRGLPYHLSIDIDVLDPVHAPGTSTPVPGGLTLRELKSVLRAIGESCDISSLDLVEVNPLFDSAGTTAAAACEVLLVALHGASKGSPNRFRESQNATLPQGETSCKSI